MLKARGFVEIDASQRQLEVDRLESLFGQIVGQQFDEKQRLVKEFLEILEDGNEKMHVRMSACTVLGARRKDLEIVGSEAVVKRLRKVLKEEFLLPQRRGFLGLKSEMRLRKIGQRQLLLLLALLAAMLRIDFANTREIVEAVANQVDHPHWKKTMDHSLAIIRQEAGENG